MLVTLTRTSSSGQVRRRSCACADVQGGGVPEADHSLVTSSAPIERLRTPAWSVRKWEGVARDGKPRSTGRRLIRAV